MRIISTNSAKKLANEVCGHLQINLTETNFKRFSDAEIDLDITETVRNRDVYIIASTSSSDDIIELLLLVNAAKSASAKTINVVFAYYGYSRQDRKDRHRGAIGAKMIANCLEANGVNHITLLDIHANQIQGFFNCSTDLLYGYKFFADKLKYKIKEDTIIVAPDLGASKRARDLSKMLNDQPIAIIDKRRDKPNSIEEMTLLGDVKGKNCIIIDDIIDTAGTLCKAAEHLLENGAKSVSACITHPVLSGQAISRLNKSVIETLWISDSIEKKILPKNAKIISCSKVLARTINNHKNGISIHIKI